MQYFLRSTSATCFSFLECVLNFCAKTDSKMLNFYLNYTLIVKANQKILILIFIFYLKKKSKWNEFFMFGRYRNVIMDKFTETFSDFVYFVLY